MHKSLYSRPNEVFLALLRGTRMARQLRQSDLAIRLGRSQAIVSRVESGARRIDVVELLVWLNALDTDIVSFAQELHHHLEVSTIRTNLSTNKRPRLLSHE